MRLNLGCGLRKKENYINIDNREEVNPDLLLDIEKHGLMPYEDNSIDEVRAQDFLEHIKQDKVIYIIEEIYRVLKPEGIFYHYTPSTDGRGAFQDPYHKSWWNINSFKYYMNDKYRVLYNIKAKFKGNLRNVIAGDSVIYVEGLLRAVKEER